MAKQKMLPKNPENFHFAGENARWQLVSTWTFDGGSLSDATEEQGGIRIDRNKNIQRHSETQEEKYD